MLAGSGILEFGHQIQDGKIFQQRMEEENFQRNNTGIESNQSNESCWFEGLTD